MLQTSAALRRWTNSAGFLRKPELKIHKKTAYRTKGYTSDMHARFQRRKMHWKENIHTRNTMDRERRQHEELRSRYESEIQRSTRGRNADPEKSHRILECAASMERIRKAGKNVNSRAMVGFFHG